MMEYQGGYLKGTNANYGGYTGSVSAGRRGETGAPSAGSSRRGDADTYNRDYLGGVTGNNIPGYDTGNTGGYDSRYRPSSSGTDGGASGTANNLNYPESRPGEANVYDPGYDNSNAGGYDNRYRPSSSGSELETDPRFGTSSSSSGSYSAGTGASSYGSESGSNSWYNPGDSNTGSNYAGGTAELSSAGRNTIVGEGSTSNSGATPTDSGDESWFGWQSGSD